MIVSTNTSINTTVIADEVRIVNNATLVITGTLICRILVIESGIVIIEGLGAIYIVDDVQKVILNMIVVTVLQFAPILVVFAIIYLLRQLFKELPVKK